MPIKSHDKLRSGSRQSGDLQSANVINVQLGYILQPQAYTCIQDDTGLKLGLAGTISSLVSGTISKVTRLSLRSYSRIQINEPCTALLERSEEDKDYLDSKFRSALSGTSHLS